MSDRSKRMKLDDDNCYPLGILHIGRSRGLDLLPKRAARLSLNVYDVEMRNWSFLTVFSKTRATMIPSFAPERKLETHIPDYHIVIIPCISEEGCNLSRTCQHCMVDDGVKKHDASDDQGKETTYSDRKFSKSKFFKVFLHDSKLFSTIHATLITLSQKYFSEFLENFQSQNFFK